jgi:multidrug resistance protein, MATE family
MVLRQVLNKQMLALALPLLLSNLAGVLLGVTDTFFAGQLGTNAVAAVGLGVLWYLTLFLLPRGMVGSIVPFVSQAFGANDLARAGRWLGNFLAFGAALLPLLVVYVPVLHLAIGASGAAQEVQALALQYATVRLLEIPFALLVTALVGFLIGIGDSRTPMLLNWGMVLGNVFLNWVFVYGMLGAPKLGLVGTAVGSVLSFVLGALVLSILVWRWHRRTYSLRLALPSRPEWLEMVKIGTPMGFLEMLEVSAFAAFLGLTARISTEALAASQIGNQISALAFMPGFALGSATASLVGRYIGASDLETANRACYTGVRFGMIWMSAIGVVFLVFAEPLARLFSSDERVVLLTASLLRLMTFYQLFDAVNIVFRSALLGTGDTRFPALLTLFCAWSIMVGGGYLIVQSGGGLLHVWLAPFAYLTLLALVYWQRWRFGHWKTLRLGQTQAT